MLRAMDEGADLSSLRAAVSAGETLPAPVYEEWMQKTGKPMLDGIGATEMLHIFITNRFGDSHPACTGKPVTGYEARIVDEAMNEVPRGEVGRLAVRGPTGCRYLATTARRTTSGRLEHHRRLVRQDEGGYFHFAARNDDMIISSGYNIAGPDVEAACSPIPTCSNARSFGAPDEERGQIVEAHVVLTDGAEPSEATVLRLQNHVKDTIAPYKYPRRVVFAAALPKTQTGKIQRFMLRKGQLMTDFSLTRAAFHIPHGITYLDGNSLGPLPLAAEKRAQEVIAGEWGEMLITAWNKANWMDMPRRIGDRIARLIGAAPGTVVIGDTLSIKVYQALAAALDLRPDRKVVLSDSGNFPTDLYMAQGLLRSLGKGHELRVVAPEEVEAAIDEDVAALMLTHVDYRTGRMHDMES
jgi:hypothetical protein